MHRPPAAPSGTDLERLLAAEARATAQLATARDEARRLVAAAEADAAATRAETHAACRQAEQALHVQITSERDQAIARTDAEARARVGALEAVPDAVVRALADRIVTRVLGGVA